MYSDEIGSCLARLAIFNGVYALDQLDQVRLKRPSVIIVNLDKSNSVGSHWCAIYFDKDNGAFWFDSFVFYSLKIEIVKFLNRNARKWNYNKRQLQSFSTDVCGQAVCVSIYLFCK